MNFKLLIEELLLEEKRIEFLYKQFVETKKLTKQEFDQLVKADPTPQQKYLPALIKWVMYYKKQTKRDLDKRRNEINYRLFFEDLEFKIKSNLELHNRIPSKFKHSDILKYENAEDFNSDGSYVKDNLDYLELQKGREKKVVYEESLKIGETKTYNVYKIPKGRMDLYPASKYFASGTDWCTKGSDQFANYIKMDDLFIFVSKVDPNTKYQLHVEEMQIADKFDDQKLLRHIPDYEEIIKPSELCQTINSSNVIKGHVKSFIKQFQEKYNTVDFNNETVEKLYYDIDDLILGIKDNDYEEIYNIIMAKYENVFIKQSSMSLIQIEEPEIFDFCLNKLNVDLNELMDKAEDFTSTAEWEEYNNQHFDNMVNSLISECVVKHNVANEIRKYYPSFEW